METSVACAPLCPPAVKLQVKKTFLLRYIGGKLQNPSHGIEIIGFIFSGRKCHINPLKNTQVRRNRQLYPKVILNVGGEKHEVVFILKFFFIIMFLFILKFLFIIKFFFIIMLISR